MIHHREVLNKLIRLNKLTRELDIDLETFSTLTLYTLVSMAQAVQNLPPALQFMFHEAVLQSVDEVTREAGTEENEAAWKLLRTLGLTHMPTQQDYLDHLEANQN